MNHYFKLLHYELFRVRKLYLVLFGLTLLLQFVGLFLYTSKVTGRANEAMLEERINAAQYVASYGSASFYRYTTELWFAAPIGIGASILLLYVFLIWYRDWFGKNMFIYRLLMLPSSRMNVYLAKLSTIVLLVLGLISLQLLILPLQNALFNGLVPAELRTSTRITDLIANHPLLTILVPGKFLEFLLYYVLGTGAVIIAFTAILIERSYRLKGAIAGLAYTAATMAVVILPILLSELLAPGYLYAGELFGIELAVTALLIGCSIWLSSYLLKKKITV